MTMLRTVISWLLLRLIWIYQGALSPLIGPACRFEPTCSRYAAEAIERFGPWRGAALAVGRLIRCHPLCRGGVDPVPEQFTIRPNRPHPPA